MPVEEEDPSYVYVLANTVRLQDAAQVVADARRAYLTAWNMPECQGRRQGVPLAPHPAAFYTQGHAVLGLRSRGVGLPDPA